MFIFFSGVVRMLVHVIMDEMPDLGDLNDKMSKGGLPISWPIYCQRKGKVQIEDHHPFRN